MQNFSEIPEWRKHLDWNKNMTPAEVNESIKRLQDMKDVITSLYQQGYYTEEVKKEYIAEFDLRIAYVNSNIKQLTLF